jgi:hypothetical protein
LLAFFFFFYFLGSTAQLRPWPPPQNPAEFLGGFSTIFFFYRVGLLVSRPTPIPEDQASDSLYLLVGRYFAFNRNSKFPVRKKELIS